MGTKRTDPHRPGAIIPSDYEHVLWYSLATSVEGWPQPSSGVNCELDRRVERLDENGKLLEVINGKHSADGHCCVVGLRQSGAKFAETSRDHGTGRCTVCGAYFVYGEVWQYKPTGELIHVGHDCADKYNLVADRSEWIAWHKEQKDLRAAAILKREKATARDKFIAEHKLEEAYALREKHPILGDIFRKLYSYGSLSEKQVAFALKLEAEVKNPPPPEKHVPAPEGRVVVDGRIVSVKTYDSAWGSSIKITVKVETPEGNWLVWSTLPSSIFTASRGDRIRFTATLKRGNEPHFAFGKRPTKAELFPQVAPETVNA
jgi:hypothetical protein